MDIVFDMLYLDIIAAQWKPYNSNFLLLLKLNKSF